VTGVQTCALPISENSASVSLLEKLGLNFQKTITLDDEEIQLYMAAL